MCDREKKQNTGYNLEEVRKQIRQMLKQEHQMQRPGGTSALSIFEKQQRGQSHWNRWTERSRPEGERPCGQVVTVASTGKKG